MHRWAEVARQSAVHEHPLGDPESIWATIRDMVASGTQPVCGYCGRELLPRDRDFPYARSLSLDHRIPLSHGGDGSVGNIEVVCYACNMAKRGQSIDTWFAVTSALRLGAMRSARTDQDADRRVQNIIARIAADVLEPRRRQQETARMRKNPTPILGLLPRGIPVIEVRVKATRGPDSFWALSFWCSRCETVHGHGGGHGTDPPSLTSRASHCSPDRPKWAGSSEYWLVAHPHDRRWLLQKFRDSAFGDEAQREMGWLPPSDMQYVSSDYDLPAAPARE